MPSVPDNQAAEDWEGLHPPSGVRRARRFAAALGRGARRIGLAARALATPWMQARGGLAERLLARYAHFRQPEDTSGRGFPGPPRFHFLRLRRPLVPPHITHVVRRSLAGRVIREYVPLVSWRTRLVPVRERGAAPNREPRVAQSAPGPGPVVAPVFVSRWAVTTPPAGGPGGRAVSSSAVWETVWRERAPRMEAQSLSRPPLPQASWLGIAPSAPPPAPRLSLASARAVAASLPPALPSVGLPALPSIVTRPSPVTLLGAVSVARSFAPRPLSNVAPADKSNLGSNPSVSSVSVPSARALPPPFPSLLRLAMPLPVIATVLGVAAGPLTALPLAPALVRTAVGSGAPATPTAARLVAGVHEARAGLPASFTSRFAASEPATPLRTSVPPAPAPFLPGIMSLAALFVTRPSPVILPEQMTLTVPPRPEPVFSAVPPRVFPAVSAEAPRRVSPETDAPPILRSFRVFAPALPLLTSLALSPASPLASRSPAQAAPQLGKAVAQERGLERTVVQASARELSVAGTRQSAPMPMLRQSLPVLSTPVSIPAAAPTPASLGRLVSPRPAASVASDAFHVARAPGTPFLRLATWGRQADLVTGALPGSVSDPPPARPDPILPRRALPAPVASGPAASLTPMPLLARLAAWSAVQTLSRPFRRASESAAWPARRTTAPGGVSADRTELPRRLTPAAGRSLRPGRTQAPPDEPGGDLEGEVIAAFQPPLLALALRFLDGLREAVAATGMGRETDLPSPTPGVAVLPRMLSRTGGAHFPAAPLGRGEWPPLPTVTFAGRTVPPTALVAQGRRADGRGPLGPPPGLPLPMALPQRAAPPMAEEGWAIQRVAAGSPGAARSAAGGEAKSPQQDVNLVASEKGAAANDVYLLANEVWSLLRRRLETEAERTGRR